LANLPDHDTLRDFFSSLLVGPQVKQLLDKFAKNREPEGEI
jgi:hypothetical protein